jgi:hypothetical protein
VLDVVLVVELDGCDVGALIEVEELADGLDVAGSAVVCAWAAAAVSSIEEITIARWFFRISNTLRGSEIIVTQVRHGCSAPHVSVFGDNPDRVSTRGIYFKFR